MEDKVYLDDIYIIKHRKEVDYTTIYNDCINDESIQADALGVLVYVMSKPDDWSVLVKNLCNRFQFGRDKARRIINDLQESGYMKRVRRRKKDGSLSKIVIYTSDKPIFLKPKPPNPKKVDINLPDKQPQTGFQAVVENPPQTPLPEPGFQAVVPYIQNKDLTKTTTTTIDLANTDQEPPSKGLSAVVSSLMKKIEGIGISEYTLSSWIVTYGESYVSEKVSILKETKNVANKVAYLTAAIKHDWKKKNPDTKAFVPTEVKQPREEIKYDEAWFKQLTADEKMKIYETVRASWNGLEEMLKINKLSFLNEGFESSPWFKPAMDVLKRHLRL